MLDFIGAQLGVTGDALLDYGAREATRYQHSAALHRLYGYCPFEGLVRRDIADWFGLAAEDAQSNDGLAGHLFGGAATVPDIVPAPSTVERLCADVLVFAERAIAGQVPPGHALTIQPDHSMGAVWRRSPSSSAG